ncbi:MAG TPA: tetratricopeptide repeat protein [Streptosporangiaceae bacterium]|nr:tetratricopeptide repeat protein [Streptosporangiaceae bacterium]
MSVTEVLQEAQQLEAVGRWDQAADLYERKLIGELAVADRALLLARLTRSLREDDRYDDADERIGQAKELVDEHEEPRVCGLIRLEEGKLCEYQGDHRGARRKYAKALALFENFEEERLQAILASAALERSLGELRRAEELLQQVDRNDLAGEPLADYLGALGAIQLARGDYRSAEETLSQALELDEAQSTEYGAAETRLLLAQAYLSRGDRDRARRLIEEVKDDVEAVDDTATLSDTLSLLGQLYEESDDYVNAVRWYQQGLNLDLSAQDLLGQSRAYIRLARTFRKRGDLRRAQDNLEEARPLCRDNDVERAELLTEEGNLALDQGDYTLAEDKFRQAKQLIEDDGDDRRTAIAARHLARALQEKGDLPRAEALLREAMPVLRDRGDLRELDDLLDDLGEVLLEQDRYHEALNALEESYGLDQQIGAVASQGRTLLLRGQALLRAGDREKAGKSLQSALDIYRHVGDEVGESNARFRLGEWYECEGQLDRALEHFRAGQAIDSRHDDRLGLGRTARALASIYRRKGDARRATELLAEAKRELLHTDDTVERAMLEMEAGRIAQARGAYDDAEESLRAAARAFDSLESTVQSAKCQRLLGSVAFARGRYDQAQSLYERAREEFRRSSALLELDEICDDIGELYLRQDRLDDAEETIKESLQLGLQMSWRRGNGRSLLLLARVALTRQDLPQARKYAADALDNYREAKDDVGMARTRLTLGDCLIAEDQSSAAIIEYKHARRIDMRMGNERGLAKCYRKLGRAYRMRGEWIRAEESLEQAQEYGQSVQDLREQALYRLEFGTLKAAVNDHAAAIPQYHQAAKAFEELSDQRNLTIAYQRLAASYQAQGHVEEALSYMRETAQGHANLWALMIRDLDPLVAGAAERGFMDGHYVAAAMQAYVAIEQRIREAAGDTGGTRKISELVSEWLNPRNGGAPKLEKSSDLGNWAQFIRASFSLVRNPMVHGSTQMSAREAFVVLCMADFIAQGLLARQVSGSPTPPIPVDALAHED